MWFTVLLTAFGGFSLLGAGYLLFRLLFAGIIDVMRGIAGPPSLSRTKCLQCRKRRAMVKVREEFLRPNVKFPFDYYQVHYECRYCGHEVDQQEHLPPRSQ